LKLKNQTIESYLEEAKSNVELQIIKIEKFELQISQLNKKLLEYQEESQSLKKAIKDKDKANIYRILMLQATLVGNIILNAMLLLFVTLSRKEMFGEIVGDIVTLYSSVVKLLRDVLKVTLEFLNNTTESAINVSEHARNGLSMTILIIIFILFVVLIKRLFNVVKGKSNHRAYYHRKGNSYKLFKRLITLDIVIAIYVFILLFYEHIELFISLKSILALWAILSAIGIALWNIKDWINGFRA